MRPKGFIQILIQVGLIVTLSGCYSGVIPRHVEMEIKAYSDPDVSLDSLRKYWIIPSDKENPLLEKALLRDLRTVLSASGLKEDVDHPDFLILLSTYVGSYNRYIPPKTFYVPEYEAGERRTYTGQFGNIRFDATEQSEGKWRTQLHTIDGYNIQQYLRAMTLYFYNPVKNDQTDSYDLIWQGEVTSGGSSSDIRVVSPYLLRELLKEFPNPSGYPAKRMVPFQETEVH